jgi:hypothetical protein
MRIAWIVPLLALVAIALLLIAGPGVHMGWWNAATGMQVLKWSTYVGIGTAVLGVAMLINPWTRRRVVYWLVMTIISGIAVAWVPCH